MIDCSNFNSKRAELELQKKKYIIICKLTLVVIAHNVQIECTNELCDHKLCAERLDNCMLQWGQCFSCS